MEIYIFHCPVLIYRGIAEKRKAPRSSRTTSKQASVPKEKAYLPEKNYKAANSESRV